MGLYKAFGQLPHCLNSLAPNSDDVLWLFAYAFTKMIVIAITDTDNKHTLTLFNIETPFYDLL